MTITLPEPIPSASGWALSDFLRLQYRSDAAAGGQAVLELPQLPDNELWLLDHMVALCDSSTRTTLRLYQDYADPLHLLEGSSAGNFTVGDWPAGLQVAPGGRLLAVWTEATNGARGVLTMQGRLMRRR